MSRPAGEPAAPVQFTKAEQQANAQQAAQAVQNLQSGRSVTDEALPF
jgi:hypothetical protein